MNVQGSYNNQVGKDLHTSGPAFQQLPPPPPPPPRHHGPFAPQPQAIQQGHPSFHPTPDSFKNRHALPSFPHQGPPAPVVPSGMSSAQSYLSHTQPPHTRNQISHPYPTSEQHVPWSQNVHQLPPPPTAPFPGPNAYPLPSPQGHTLERGQSNRYPSHGPLPGPPPLPPYPTSSNYLTSDPFGSSAFRQHSYLQPMGPPPPPPPPPPLHPPLPSSSPPRVPPLPPSSPPSDVPSKNGGIRSSNDVLDEDNSMLEHPIPVKSAEDRNLHQNEVPCHYTEYNGPTMESTDAVVAYSPTGSDMEMEDDITHPDEEEKDLLSAFRDGGCTSVSQEEFLKEQPQALQHIGEHKGSKNALHENLLFGAAAELMDQREGSEVVPCRKVSSETDESGMTKNGQTEQPLMTSVNESFPQQKYSSERSVALVCEETGNEELSRQHLEGVNSFNLLQGYASDNISENEGDNLLGDASSPALGGSINSDAERECVIEPKIRVQSPSESDTPVHPESLTESPRNVLEAGKFSLANGILEELSDEGHRGRESVTTSAPLQSKDPSRSHDTCIGLESAKFEKQDMKSNFPEMEVDEFGRLVREGGSDSDTSDSPRSTRRHARRSRKRSNSRSRSRSPHERRRSPRRNKRSRDRSRSLSPNRRRIRSRSPFLRRDTEFSGDKRRGEKSQLQECFDFRRGKCYRGSTCRYLHHETNNSEILRCNRGKQQSTLWSPVHEEGKVHCDKEVNDKELPQDMPSLREEVRVAKELPVDWNSHSPDKLSSLVSGSLPFADVVKSNRSGYSAYHMPSGKENPLILESPARCSDKVPQIVHQQGKMMGDYLVSESSSLVQASSAHLTAEQPGTEEGPTSQLLSVVSPITKPYSTEEVQPESLKEEPISVASQSTIPLPPVSQVMTASFGQDYKTIPPIAGFHSTPENRSPYQAPAAYQQHSRFHGPSNSLSSPYLPPPPPLPPPHHLSVNIALGEHGNPSQHTQQPLQHPRDGLLSYTSIRAHPTEMPNHSQTYQYQAYQLPREADRMLHTNENFASSSLHVSNLSSLNSGPRITGPPVQGMHPSQSFSQAQNYSLRANSPSKATHSSFGGGLPSDINSSHGQPYFQHSSYGLQYSSGGIPVQFARSEKVSSSMSSLTPDLLEKNQPSYVHNFIGSRISNHFNPYASTFDKPLNSKLKFNSSIGINDTITVPDASVVSKNIISSSSSGLPALSVLPRPGGDQYDPLFDSIDPPSTLFNRAAQEKHETPGDSDNMPRFTGSGRVLDMEIIKQDEAIALSANDSMENEEFGETAEGEVNDVSNGSPCTPNDATDVNGEETESDQMKASRKKRKGKDSRSMKLFKISVAGFVKDVLKPSWRQGNMSKEAFKTIVKKTVDKVSGAMKGHRVPKSQSKINQYIDSSRGKLTKLVMGYVDKYVKS